MQKLPEKHRQRIITRHKASIERYGYEPAALFWKGRDVQNLRFALFLEWMESQDKSCHEDAPCVLDVGCGFADLYKFFTHHGLSVNYTGLDVSPDMIFAAQNIYPDLLFLNGEIYDFELEDESFDWVFMSGALNEVLDDSGEYAFGVIRKMYALAKHGVAFNLLNKAHEWTFQCSDLMSFDAQKVKKYCQTFCSDVEVRMDYLPNDFTVFLRK
ncbi:class I SAM-dependent methyltransferase [Hydrogenovibrio sp. JE_KL2]|uniref:class I SAM-dependent methyltransferase n=1 Tax=Hydrogenovibrio sp. JE_KL2 TaxID=2651188 RepID=UPI00128B3465|nr:class I SAM-dependent methyltransferase [Hydrogenovibrio sp. JE_KL2]